MISYSVYKMIHLISLFAFFTMISIQFFSEKPAKIFKILTGVFSLLILVSGMGLIARLGFPHGEAWPLWINLKLGIALVLIVGAPVVVKRFSKLKAQAYWFSMLLMAAAVWIVINKVT